MGFYEEVSKYYDYIFPVQAPQLNFLSKTLGREGQTALDVACATGGYAAALSELGFDVTAFDEDPSMMEACRQRMKEGNFPVRTFQGNMLEVRDLDENYDLVYCVGNSLVHLDSLEDVGSFLQGCYKVLRPGGRVVLQVVNYDRILGEGISNLPTIFNSEVSLSFERLYEYQEETGKILFTGKLEVWRQQFVNTVALLPILSKDLMALVDGSGFKDVEIYGDFMKKPFDPKTSLHTVIRGRVEK